MKKIFRKVEVCSNCGTQIKGFNYCPNCGQINSHRQIHLSQIIKELFGEYFTFDSKFFRSLWPLISRPGFLTKEYLSGRHSTYILPLRLYIFTTFMFFLVLSLTSHLDPYGTNDEQLQVNADTLKTFMSRYKVTIPEATRLRLVYDLDRTYSILKKSTNEKRNALPDTLEKYIRQYQPQIDDTLAFLYADRLYMEFDYYPKGRLDSTSVRIEKRMEDILNTYGFSKEARSAFIARVKQKYDFKKADFRDQNINISINDADTSAFARKLQANAERLFSQGKRGWAIFWNQIIRQIPKIMFFLLPVFALMLKLFYIRQNIFYINHLIFSLHVHSVLFIYLIMAVFIPKVWIIGIILFAIWLHTFLSFKNVYNQSYLMTFLKLNSLLTLYFIVLVFAFLGLSLFTIWIS